MASVFSVCSPVRGLYLIIEILILIWGTKKVPGEENPPLERDIAEEANKIARVRGAAVETLLNLWIKEKIVERKA